jgi:hypothetical protein
MAKTPKEVFEAFADEDTKKDHLRWIADQRNIETTDKSTKTLINDLADHVSNLGISKMLQILKLKELRALAEYCDGRDKIPTGKATIAKKIIETMEEVTPAEFLSTCEKILLKSILKTLGVDRPPNKDYVPAIISAANEMGLENLFSSFGETKLKEFVKCCGHKVDSESLDNLIQALVEQQSIKAPYEAGDEQPSKVAPSINDPSISVVDLYHHYFREELMDFCKQHKLVTHGSKKELVERIRRFHADKLEEKDKKRPPRPKKIFIDC